MKQLLFYVVHSTVECFFPMVVLVHISIYVHCNKCNIFEIIFVIVDFY